MLPIRCAEWKSEFSNITGLSMRRAVIDAIWPLAPVMIGILVAMITAEHVKVRFE